MSLFKTNDVADYAQPQHRQASVVATDDQATTTLLLRENSTLADCWPSLTTGQTVHYASAGLWSCHDLLFHLLRQTGPARVWIATWSMTEEPVRMLVQGLETGLITELRALLDVRVKVRNPSVWAFARHNLARVSLSICHAKVTVIENEQWAIAINGSPNYTNNPRIESGVVSASRDVAAFHRTWIDAEIDKAKPFAP